MIAVSKESQCCAIKILVTGVTGQIGFELVRTLQGLGEVIAVDRTTFDLTKPDQMRDVVRAIRPTVIVNAAAYTAVDEAQSKPGLAMQINGQAPGVLAEEAKRLGSALIHYSTDYIFNGEKDSPYVEEDFADPKNFYGISKLAGEQAITGTGVHHLILRTSWVYGMRGKNFLLTMLRLGRERDQIQVVIDQIGAPTWSNTIAVMTAHIVSQALSAVDVRQWWQDRSGIYHLTAAGSTSWHGFAEAIFAAAALKRTPTILPISVSEYPTSTKRPVNSRLSNDKLERVFGLHLPHWNHALNMCIQTR